MEQKEDKKNEVKKKSLIRWEAIVPASIVLGVGYLYGVFFLDTHLKWAMEQLGYQIMGAEVNVARVETSFFKAQISIEGLEITNEEKPTHNLISLGRIFFGMSWDALLRGKILIEEMSVRDIALDTKRARPGKVAPPKPPSPNDDALTQALMESKKKALGIVASKYDDSAVGDLASYLKGEVSPNDILNQVKDQLKTEKHVQAVQTWLNERTQFWEQKKQTLPKPETIQDIINRSRQIKTSNFTQIQEVEQSVREFQKLQTELNQHLQTLQSAWSTLEQDSKKLTQDIRAIDGLIKNDLNQVRNYLQLPKIDTRNIVKTIVMEKIQPYLARLGYYRDIAQKYMPPNLGKKKEPDQVELALQPRPRDKGVTYEFGRPGSYPLFWIKKIAANSVAQPQKGIGDLAGSIEHITSNQALIQRATTINFSGSFPHLSIDRVSFSGQFDNRQKESVITYELKVGPYPFEGSPLIQSDQVNIFLKPSSAHFHSRGNIRSFQNLDISFQKDVINTSFEVTSPNPSAQEFLSKVFADLNQFAFTAQLKGKLPKISIAIDSDFGRLLGANLLRELRNSFEAVKNQVTAQVQQMIDQQKSQLLNQAKAFENDIQKQIAAVKNQVEAEKKRIDEEIKKTEKQIKNQVGDQLNQEINRAKEDLRKKLGL